MLSATLNQTSIIVLFKNSLPNLQVTHRPMAS